MIWFLQQNKSLCHTDVFLVKNNFSRGYLNPPFRYYALSGMLTDACEGKQVIGLSLSRNVEYNALRIRGLSKHHNHSLQINGFVSPVDWHKMSVLTLTPRFSTENASLIGLAYLKSRMTNKTHEFYKNLVHFVVSNRYDADIADAKYNILGDNR
ncbi:MAG: hypothetical protein DHS20C10_10520 [marine bacterium B5-7]|nr:MAG: hypothetical protein DHS20C10_10520 [marine bacterium B5-7]